MPNSTPFVGLKSLDTSRAGLFFGRDDAVTELHQAITRSGGAILVGPIGVGKTSLLNAGLLPRLLAGSERTYRSAADHEAAWEVVAVRPRARPAVALGSALRALLNPSEAELPEDLPGLLEAVAAWAEPQNTRVLLVLDHAERLLTEARDPSERRSFFSALAEMRPATRAIVHAVFVARDDFADLLVSNLDGLRLPVVELGALPPHRATVAFASMAAAADQTLDDRARAHIAGLVAQPGGLARAQFAGYWAGTSGRESDHIADEPPLEVRLEELTKNWTEGLAPTRSLALRLIGERETLRSISLREADSVMGYLGPVFIDALGGAGVITVIRRGEEIDVELSQELLLTCWPQLKRWRAATPDRARALSELSRAAADWVESGRREDCLLSGHEATRLERVLGDEALSDDEKALLTASPRNPRAAPRGHGALRRRVASWVSILLALVAMTIAALMWCGRGLP